MLRIIAILAVIAIPHGARAAPALTVDLASGRTFSGWLGAQTDAERLWLRSGTDRMQVLRPIDWKRIVRLSVDGRVLTRDELLSERESLVERAAELSEVDAREARATQSAPPRAPAQNPMPVTPANPPAVQSLRASACAANWDADPEIDGLVVEILPLDADGGVLGVDGKLTVELVGLRTTPQNPRWRPSRIGRWVRSVSRDEFRIVGATFRLPFQADHPELDGGLASIGLVHVVLSIPGQRTVETSLTDVRVRPYSAFRDITQQTEGRRFLPIERRWRTN